MNKQLRRLDEAHVGNSVCITMYLGVRQTSVIKGIIFAQLL
jgi:hypothetical protein